MTIAIVAFVFAMSRPVFAVTTAPTLGTASTFAVLAATTVTNTGLSVITGDLGVSPGTACTGLPTPCTGNGPGVVTGGTVHAGDAVAAQAHTDLATAYAALKAMQCGTNLTGKILGTDVTTLSSGVYCFDSSAMLTGTLHVSGVVVIQMVSTLTTSVNSIVIVDDNSGCGGNVYWQVGSSATIQVGTTFAGNIVAMTAITV
ncbi:MAG TPA: ice-binding family protein, partial [Candidatus Sulfotelmatobacter sp.]|nr:ice-binding family protein [Candidatus Sulfotelmatobacter sp.]